MEDLVGDLSLPADRTGPVVLLDLDGTLLDSGDQVAEIATFALHSLGLVGADHDTLKRRTGEPADSLFQEIADPQLRGRLVEVFRAQLAEVAGGPDQVMPGVREGLTQLRGRRCRVGVATNKPTSLARTVLARSELLDLIDHVQGADGMPHKPAPDLLLAASAALGEQAHWMVGDTSMDVLAGRRAGIATIAITGGSHGIEELRAARPDLLVDGFDEAVSEIIRHSGGSL
jgi:phosphoglycolate phosphatase